MPAGLSIVFHMTHAYDAVVHDSQRAVQGMKWDQHAYVQPMQICSLLWYHEQAASIDRMHSSSDILEAVSGGGIGSSLVIMYSG